MGIRATPGGYDPQQTRLPAERGPWSSRSVRRRRAEAAKELTRDDRAALAAWKAAAPALHAKLEDPRTRVLEDVLEPAVRDGLYQSYVWNRILTIGAMRGLTATQLCAKLGKSRSMSTAYASGKAALSFPIVFAAARVLGVPVYTLFVGMDEPVAAMPYDVIADFIGRRLKREPAVMADRFRQYLVLRFGEHAVRYVEEQLAKADRLDEFKRLYKRDEYLRTDDAAPDAPAQSLMTFRQVFRTLPERAPRVAPGPETFPIGPTCVPVDPEGLVTLVSAPKGTPWYEPPCEPTAFADKRRAKPRSDGWVTRRRKDPDASSR